MSVANVSVAVCLLAAFTPGAMAQTVQKGATTISGDGPVSSVPLRTPSANTSKLSDVKANGPRSRMDVPPAEPTGVFLLDNGSMNFTSGRTVGASNQFQLFQPFTVPAPGWMVTTIGTDGWNIVDPNGGGMLGRLLPDVGGTPDEANPISSAVYFLQPDSGQSSWRDEPHNVMLPPGNYWMQWTNNGDTEHWSAVFAGVSGQDSFSRNAAGDIFPFGPTALRIAGQVIQDNLIWFNNQAEFEAFVASQGKVQKGIEDFEESTLADNSVDGFDDPLEFGVPNSPDGFPFPDGMTGLSNLIVQSNNLGNDPFDESPAGVNGLAAASVGFLGASSDIVLSNTFVNGLDLIFTTEKSGVGFSVVDALGTQTGVMVRVYSTSNVLLGSIVSPAEVTGANFLGVWSPDPIGRINLYSVGDGAEGADRIQAWEAGGCGDPGAGSCFVENGSPFCDNLECCETICALDPFCCDSDWDSICVDEAQVFCAGCGDPGAGSCVEANGTPGCDDAECCAIVCDADPFCCESFWDGFCANEALDLCAVAPANDLCENAILLDVPGFAVGFTNDATIDDSFPFCGTSITAPGIWYSAIGTGNTMTATTCSEFTEYDTKINVYCNSCADPICVGGNDDNCADFVLRSTVEWCSQEGAEYLILVQGFGGQTGGFDLSIFDDGILCAGPVDCLANNCPWDLDGSGGVGTGDLLILFAQWGTAGAADFDGSGSVGTNDLLILFANWGPCP